MLQVQGINHINLAVKHIQTAFVFYKDILGFKPLCQSKGSAYLLAGEPDIPGCLWLSLDLDSGCVRQPSACNTHIALTVAPDDFTAMAARILHSGARCYKENTSPGDSLYFLDPDDHKLEIHSGDWQQRIMAKKQKPGLWQDITWYV